MTTASPVARRMPQAIATCEPLLRARRTPRTRGSVADSRCRHGKRLVAGVIVDDDPLPIHAQLPHRLDDAGVEVLEIPGFVERRRDDGNHARSEDGL